MTPLSSPLSTGLQVGKSEFVRAWIWKQKDALEVNVGSMFTMMTFNDPNNLCGLI